ncbi:hypothetical protein LN042_35565 [Kitasatospora sp. RB6PN24]|uniref:hypothetical protein n=1 Tax=Kitasatospora humi TaxID=2893891 RepID=UPI001E54BB17|nr:hypothetical protein [Kitasatospora humi]MCC9312319.1 hypothetical protein [Kitasatospora humi]
MARIEWTRMSGDEIEELVAILVSREYPDSERIRPSRGDGGIDLLVPQADGTYWILQVKKFAQNLTASQKTQIKKSLTRLITFSRENSLKVSKWDLVTPLDPTKENRKWLRGLAGPPEVIPGWKGIQFVDGLAAKFPEVVDYYCQDGADRLAAATRDFMTLLHSGGDRPLCAADATATLKALASRINDHDPHYSYDLHVTTQEMPYSSINEDMLVAARQEQLASDVFVTIAVRARFNDAPLVREIPLQVSFTVPPDSGLREQVESFINFGTELVVESGVALTMDLPGGLSPEPFTNGGVRITAQRQPLQSPHEVRLVVTDPDGDELASVPVVFDSVTRGMNSASSGQMHGADTLGVIDVTLKLDFLKQTMVFSISLRETTGRRLEDLLPAFQLRAHWGHPNRMAMVNPYQPAPVQWIPIDLPIEEGTLPLLKVVEALLEIQRARGRAIRMPSIMGEPVAMIEPWVEAGRLLRGEEIHGTWDSISLTVSEDLPPELQTMITGAVVMHTPLIVEIAGERIELGTKQVCLASARLTAPAVPGQSAVLEPADDDTAVIRLVPPTGASEARGPGVG